MVKTMLQKMNIRTSADLSKTERKAERGVYHGSSLSSTLFNVYMDTYTDMTEEKLAESEPQENPSNWGGVFSDDNVKLQTATSEKLKQLLHVSTIWDLKFGPTWSTEKCKIIASKLRKEGEVFKLASQELEVLNKGKFPGKLVTNEELTAENSLKAHKVPSK